MKIVIVGPGALGCLIAGFLTKYKNKDNQVLLLDKDSDRAGKINKTGIIIETSASQSINVNVKVTAKLEDIALADLVILCVKSYDTKSAIEKIKPFLANETVIFTLQNGIGNIEIIDDIIGTDKIVAGVTNMGATWLDTGKIRFAGKGETIIGKLDGKTLVQMRYIREIFNKAGFETKISQDIKGLIWSKLVISAGINALTSLTRVNNGKLINNEFSKELLRQAVTEAVKVAKRKRIKLIYDDPLAKAESVCEATSNNISSMLQDVLRRKRTEIDFINGVIVRFGQELSIPVPVNTTLVNLVKTIEANYDYQL